MAQNDLAQWYHSIPQITKYWFTADVVLPLASRMGLIDGNNLVLVPELIWKRFHIWRPLTALSFFPIAMGGFHYLMMLYFLYSYSVRIEREEFTGKPADMAYMLLIIGSASVLVGILMNMMILFEIPIIAVLYVWCQLNKDVMVRFFFGVTLKAQYLPWVLCLFNMIVKGGGMMELIGIFVGHIYFFLKFRYAQDFGGPDVLRTPQWIQNYFPGTRVTAGFGNAPSRAQNDNQGGGGGGAGGRPAGWFGGAGHRLGE